MPNVPVPDALKADLQLSGLVVWEAKRVRKGEPINLTLAGPGLDYMPYGWGLTIEEAVASALRSHRLRASRSGLDGAMARLEEAAGALRWAVWSFNRPPHDGLDDDVPF